MYYCLKRLTRRKWQHTLQDQNKLQAAIYVLASRKRCVFIKNFAYTKSCFAC